MRIKAVGPEEKPIGYTMWLSALDTFRWANRDGRSWPCSTIADKRLRVDVGYGGIEDLSINGRCGDCDGTELDAIVGDHLPKHLRHLWPVWDDSTKGKQ